MLGIFIFNQTDLNAAVLENVSQKVSQAMILTDQEGFSGVKVLEFKGRVLLIGHVANDQSIYLASQIAQSIEGVREVYSGSFCLD